MIEQSFSRGQKVYDEHGGEYLYSDRVDDGHYANKIILIQSTTYSGDDFDENEEGGEIVLLKNVYASPPTQKINDEIERLSKQKAELATHVTDLQREQRNLSREAETYKDKIASEVRKYQHHQMFLHAAGGGDLVILNTKTFCVDDLRGGVLRFDISTGQFDGTWWDCESGNTTFVVFKSLEDAGAYFLSHADTSFEANNRRYDSEKNPVLLVKKYQQFGLRIPSELQRVLDDRKAQDRERRRESLTKEIQELQQNLAALEGGAA